MSNTPSPKEAEELRRQLEVLKAKASQATEPFVRDALNARVLELEVQLGIETEAVAPEPDLQPEPEPEPTHVTPQVERQFFVATPAGQAGPFPASELVNRLEAGEFAGKALFWTEGATAWLGREHFEEFVDRQHNDQTDQSQPEQPAKKRPGDDLIIPPAASPEAKRQADEFLKQAQFLKLRGQGAEGQQMLNRALEVAPGYGLVHVTIGDWAMEKGQRGTARASYLMAHKLEPKNVPYERKYAESVFAASSGMTLESAILFESEAVASAKAATVFSAIIPGAGQFVLEDNIRGGVHLGIWVVTILGLSIMKSDVSNLVRTVSGRGGPVSPVLYIIILIGIANWIASVANCAAKAKGTGIPLLPGGAPAPPEKPSRPVPPVNLPFE